MKDLRNTSNLPKIVVVGSSNTDMVVQTAKIPAAGQTILGEKLVMAAGGKGANQAVAAARLGMDVTLVARVGTDLFGDQSIENFEREGICTEFVIRDDGSPSGVALIMVDDKGENAIAVAPGANSQLSEADVNQARERIQLADVLLLQLEIPLTTVCWAARLAVQSGVRVILNPAPAAQLDEELLQAITVLTPNQSEAQMLSGMKIEDQKSAHKAADFLRKKGARNVVITLGAEGVLLVTEEEAERIPGQKVKAVDTTGAGDAFNGALACGLASGESLQRAVRFANLAGAFSVTRLGAQPSMPTREQLKEFEKEAGLARISHT